MSTPPSAQPRKSHIEPLWERVDRNRWRLVGYLGGFWIASTLWIAGLVWLMPAAVWLNAVYRSSEPVVDTWWPSPLVILAVAGSISALYAWWSLARSDRVIRNQLGAVFVPKGELYETKMVVKDMAIASGMPVAPTLYRIATPNVNAFAFHAFGRRPILGVTDGLVSRLTLDEQRAVYANLIARIQTQDVRVVSAVAALMVPLHIWRDYRLASTDDELTMFAKEDNPPAPSSGQAGGAIVLLIFVGAILVLLGEILAASFRRSQLTAAEKADAEGMLLLKHPGAMLSALTKAVRMNNTIVAAGDMYGPLFYCWTGDSTDDEDDPEWRRVSRLREVLGAEGHLLPSDPAFCSEPVAGLAPPAPRVSRSE